MGGLYTSSWTMWNQAVMFTCGACDSIQSELLKINLIPFLAPRILLIILMTHKSHKIWIYMKRSLVFPYLRWNEMISWIIVTMQTKFPTNHALFFNCIYWLILLISSDRRLLLSFDLNLITSYFTSVLSMTDSVVLTTPQSSFLQLNQAVNFCFKSVF